MFGKVDEIGGTYLIEFETSNNLSGRGIVWGIDKEEAEENFERWWNQTNQDGSFGGLEYTKAIAIIHGPGIAWISTVIAPQSGDDPYVYRVSVDRRDTEAVEIMSALEEQCKPMEKNHG